MSSRLLKEQLNAWCTNEDNVLIFAEFSTMVMMVVMYAVMGRQFTEKYAKELISLVQTYEVALQDPLAKGLPLWASERRCLIKSVEMLFKRIIDDEVKKQIKNPENYKGHVNYFQQLINQKEIHEGTIQ